MKKTIKNIVFYALVAIAVVFVGARLLGYSPYNVETISMEPDYPPNTLVYVKETDFSELDVGDVITYVNQSGSNVTHRITFVDSKERCVKTKGDANEFEDIMPVYEENILGEVKFKIPYIGKLSSFITQVFDDITQAKENFVNERQEQENL